MFYNPPLASGRKAEETPEKCLSAGERERTTQSQASGNNARFTLVKQEIASATKAGA